MFINLIKRKSHYIQSPKQFVHGSDQMRPISRHLFFLLFHFEKKRLFLLSIAIDRSNICPCSLSNQRWCIDNASSCLRPSKRINSRLHSTKTLSCLSRLYILMGSCIVIGHCATIGVNLQLAKAHAFITKSIGERREKRPSEAKSMQRIGLDANRAPLPRNFDSSLRERSTFH